MLLCEYCSVGKRREPDGYYITTANVKCDGCEIERGFFYEYGNVKIKKAINGSASGKIPSRRKTLADRDGSKCHYCHENMHIKNLTVDHKHPRFLGGANELDNLVLACRKCNGEKGHTPYKKYLASKR